MNAVLVAPVLAVASSIAWGSADFAGGVAARAGNVLRVVAVSATASLVVALVLTPFLGAAWSGSSLTWGVASGVASAAAFALLYWSLALGPMSVLSPLAAAFSSLVPVTVGIATGERIGLPALGGIPLAFVAIALISGGSPAGVTRASRLALLISSSAGLAIGLQLVCLAEAPPASGIATLVVGRAVTSTILVGATLVRGARAGSGLPRPGLAAGAGALDTLANAAFLVAVRHGELAVVGPITALYPATTVLLARGLLGERLIGPQIIGLFFALAAIALLAQP